MKRLLILLSSLAACSGTKVDYGYRQMNVDRYSHESFGALLRKYVDANGKVDYAAWKANAEDLKTLNEYLNLIANASPLSRKDLFPTKRGALAYWINTYNALVIRAVLEAWPIRSVTDVKTGSDFVRGQGFFANRQYLVGGEWISLYHLENRHIRNEQDARIHFALNCGSGSCPPLPNTSFKSEDLDKTLDAMARAFINSEENVYVSAQRKSVFLSKIFDWYEADFLRAMNRAGATILDYLIPYAEAPLAEKLRTAKAQKYEIAYIEYDWTLNGK